MDIDSESRIKIISILDKNFFVEASAGSGKTTSLVRRMVALIESGVPVEKICTITFTKAAANEFFDRFLELLSIRSNEESEEDKEKYTKEYLPGDLPLTTEKSRKYCQIALANIDLCFMGTIDSFTNLIAHEFPNEFDLPASSVVVGKEEMDEIISAKYYELCVNSDSPNYPLVKRFNDIFGYKAFKTFSNGVSELMGIRNSSFVYDRDVDINLDLDDYLKAEKEYLIKFADSFIKFSDDHELNTKDNKDIAIKTHGKFNRIKNQSWNKCLIDVIYVLSKLIKIGTLPKEANDSPFLTDYIFTPEGKKKSPRLSEDTLTALTNIKVKIDEYMYVIAMTLIENSINEIAEHLKTEGKLSYFDFIYYLKQKFQESSATDHKLIDHIYKKHSYFLIDESQDTDPLQTELFFFLAGREITDDWQKSKPHPGSLFIVGDPKQSIYRFRNADISAFIKTKELFSEKAKEYQVGEVLILERNFRSNFALRRWFNESMNDVLNTKSDSLTHPDISIDINNERENGEKEATLDGVYVHCYGNSKDDTSYLADVVSTLTNNDNYLITPKDVKQDEKTNKYIPRKIKYSDFMIVPPVKTPMKNYIKEFNNRNIPFEVEGVSPFKYSKIFIGLKNLLFLMLVPTNKKYVFEVLTSSLFNFSISDITSMHNEGYSFNILEEEPTLKSKKYIDAHNKLNTLYKECRYLCYSSKLLHLLHHSDIYTHGDLNFYEGIYFAINLLKDAENNLLVTSEATCIDFMNNLEESGDFERSLHFKEKSDKVKIANVHKVKGLAAPIVILSRPSITEIEPARRIEKNDDESKAYIFKLGVREDQITNIYFETHKYDDSLYIEEANSLEAEARRLEYVAATRAQSVLLVTEYVNKDGKTTSPWKELVKNIPSNRDITLLEREETKINEIDVSTLLTNSNDLLSFKEKNNSSYHVSNPSKETKIKSYRNNDTDIDEDVISLKAKDLIKNTINIDSATKGTCVHKMMELLVNSKNHFNIPNLVNSIVKEFHVEEYKDELTIIAKIIRSGGFTQKNGHLPKNILKELLEADTCLLEVPFSYNSEGVICYGTIDCIYLKDDKWTIIDYKTNKENDVAVLEEEYFEQLNMYKEAFKNITGFDAETYIYHIDIDNLGESYVR